MAALMIRLTATSESELSPAAINQIITLSGQHLHESKISFKILKNEAIPNLYMG